jgi:hypothetical protein
VAVVLAASSCVREGDHGRDVKPAIDGMITLKVTIAEPFDEGERISPGSRSGDLLQATDGESKIGTLKFFVFKRDENTLEQYRSITINDDYTSDDPMWNVATRSLRIVVTPGAKRIYCVANWPAVPTAAMPELSDLTITDTASLLAVERGHAGITPSNPPVMSGRLVKNIVGNEQDLNITISRQVARVNIYPMLSTLPAVLGARVTIEGVKFTRLAGRSYLFERQPAGSPAGATWDQTTFEGVSSAPVTALTSADAIAYPVSYYIPENIAPDENAATCMVVKVLYNGTTTYYTVVLNGQASSPHTARYAVERNHCYAYYLTIQGIGTATASRVAPATFVNIQSK